MNCPSISNLLKKKQEAKRELSARLSFSRKKPLLAMFLDKELSANAEENIEMFLKGVGTLDVEVVVLTDSNLDTFSLPNIIILPYGRVNRSMLLKAADMALCFEFSDVEEMLLNGVIPLSSSRDEVADYDPNHETGNSFVFENEDPWCIFAALVRARETFKFPYDWKFIMRQGMGGVGE